MKLAKRIWYKLIVAMCIIVTFCTFIASTPVEASKVNKTDFYYSGTNKGSYTVEKSFLEILVNALGDIMDYLLGLCTMGFRMVFIGWTALFERCLTWIFEGATGEKIDIDSVSSTSIAGTDKWITIDAIFFNQIPLLDINFFKFEEETKYDATGSEINGETEEHNAPRVIYTEESKDVNVVGRVETTIIQGEKIDFNAAKEDDEDKSLILILKETIAGWYYTLRTISIMVMLVLLIYIGIQLATKSSATDKAVYKKMLTDWLVGMILVFSIHYIMLFIITLNEVAIDTIGKLRTGTTPLAVYEYGLKERAAKPITNEELELTLYDEVKTRAYDVKMTVGTTGMIMYMTLVYYAWKYSFIYLKRYLTVAVLVIMAPLVAVSYAYNKVTSGKATIFSKWFKEFFFIVILQTIHALIYVAFVQTALAMSLNSISGFILVLLLLNFMSKGEDLFRKIFNIQGSLTDDIARGKGIRDTLQGLKSGMTAIAVGNVAKNYTKGVAKLMTKPIRGAASLGFGAIMKERAKTLNAKAEKYGKDNGNDVKDYSDLKKALRNKRTNALKIGSILKKLDNGEINLDSLEESVNSLQEGQELYDENGTMIGIVNKKYIASKRAELDELRAINELDSDKKEDWMEEYNKWHTKNGNLNKLKMDIFDKWADIMDPTKYIEQVKDKDGNTKYKVIEKETAYGAVHFGKFTMRFGKTTDSIGKRLASQLKWDKLLGVSKEEKAALKAQTALIKNQIYGFTGLFAGLSSLADQPEVGMSLLVMGIKNSSEVLSNKGTQNERVLRRFKMDSAGKYTFKGFEGKSEHTMAEGAKAMARAQIQEIVNAKVAQEASAIARIEANHPKLTAMCKGGSVTRKAAQFATIGTLGIIGGAPAFVAGAGAAAGVKLSGNIISRIENNAWTRYQAAIRAIAKADGKALEKDEKKAGTADYLNVLADQYYELEHKQYKKDSERHAEKFGEEYAIVLATMQKEIDKKTDEELLRDSAYEEEIVIEKTTSGKTKISLDAENKLIDDALIEYAQKSGIMDISKINIDDKKDQLENILKANLITRGIIERDSNVEDIFQNLIKSLKDRQAQFKDGDKGKEAVENKIAGDAIVGIMQEKGITDPSQVSDEEALRRFNEEYRASLANVVESSEQTNNVLDVLNAQKGDGSQSPKAIDLEAVSTRATVAIQTRKSSFSVRAKKPLDDTASKAIKETLKKKNELELDKKILETEEQLNTRETINVSDIIANESGALNSGVDGSMEVNNTDNIIKMLQIQTQLHKDKDNMIFVEQKRNSNKAEKVKAYQEIMSDGSREAKVDEFHDGSRRVGYAPNRGSRAKDKKTNVSTDISEILKMKKQELKV